MPKDLHLSAQFSRLFTVRMNDANLKQRQCAVNGCDRKMHARSFCGMHYARFMRHGNVNTVHWKRDTRRKVCSVEDCEKMSRCRGWCSAHYSQWRVHGDPLKKIVKKRGKCCIDDCDRPQGYGLCSHHYQYLERNGHPLSRQRDAYNMTPPKICTTKGCKRPHSHRGLCNACAARKRREEGRFEYHAQERYRKTFAGMIEQRAQKAAHTALRSGHIAQAPCEICGEEDVQGHHDSYHPSKWLSVRWLCQRCHAEWHKTNIAELPSMKEILSYLSSLQSFVRDAERRTPSQ